MTLEGHLCVTYPVADEAYRLLAYGSRDGHSHAVFNEVVSIDSDGKFKLKFEQQQKHQPPSFLHLVLFANHMDKDDILVQSLLAWGSSKWHDSDDVHLTDVKGVIQASLKISHSTLGSTVVTANSAEWNRCETTIAEDMLNQVRETYETMNYDVNSYLGWVMTPVGKIPVLAFVASVADILTADELDEERGEQFLMHQSRIAGQNTRLLAKGWEACTSSEKAKWTVELVTLLPRAMIYQQDAVRKGSGRVDQAADQWVRLLNFPEPNLAGFDCEDSALLTLEVLYLLQHIQFRMSPLLQLMQRFLQDYTACFVFGSLQVKGKYSPHAYSALIDSSFLLNKPKASLAPAIIFEGTARIGGLWLDESNSEDTQASFRVHSTMLEVLGSNNGYARVIRNEASMKAVRDKEIYGPVYALITGDLQCKGEATHLLVSSTGSPSIGVDANDLFSYQRTQLKRAVGYKNSRDSEIQQQMCNELPKSLIPYVTSSSKVNEPCSGMFHVDMHYETYMTRTEEIEAVLLPLRADWSITAVEQQLTDQLKVMQWWFNPL